MWFSISDIKKKTEKKIGLIILFLFLIGIVFLLYSINKLKIQELEQGYPAKIFCSAKCGKYDLLIFNNNSAYKFIRCECVEKVEVTATISGAESHAKTISFYFDSESLKEISYEEVKSRISKK